MTNWEVSIAWRKGLKEGKGNFPNKTTTKRKEYMKSRKARVKEI